jgi:hypothetical protein
VFFILGYSLRISTWIAWRVIGIIATVVVVVVVVVIAHIFFPRNAGP